jgi:GWxTD domain-containing protein
MFMMVQRAVITVLLSFCGLLLQAQVLQQINFNYLYDSSLPFTLKWKITHIDNRIEIYYKLEPAVENQSLEAYSLQWELRKDLSEKEGKALPIVESAVHSPDRTSGKLVVDESAAGLIAVAKVFRDLSNNRQSVTLFYKAIPAATTPVLFQEELPVMNTFTQINRPVTLRGFPADKPLLVSYYRDEFPAAGPAFSTAMARVAPTLKPDSTFTTESNATLTLSHQGLYLVQQDTTSASGLAFRVEDDYPKLGKLESLHGPMIYICTRQEYDKLKAAGSDKTQFDKVILSITGNTDRARTFMRNYFRRVEQANSYFSSYKEGWKTDRGMIYIIYGLPEEVYLFGDREVWEYKNMNYRGRFTFVRSSTLFDPNNYVLIRDKKYTDNWYQLIDLWRKARF